MNKILLFFFIIILGIGDWGLVAIIAIANKLIRQAFAIVTNNRPYIDGYVSSLA